MTRIILTILAGSFFFMAAVAGASAEDDRDDRWDRRGSWHHGYDRGPRWGHRRWRRWHRKGRGFRFLRRMQAMRLLYADANNDGVVTWEEVEKARAKFFKRFDKNNDGQVTKEEVEAQIRKRIERRARVITSWFDSDGDGKISIKEFNQPVRKRFDWRDRNDDNKLSDYELPVRFHRMRRIRKDLIEDNGGEAEKNTGDTEKKDGK